MEPNQSHPEPTPEKEAKLREIWSNCAALVYQADQLSQQLNDVLLAGQEQLNLLYSVKDHAECFGCQTVKAVNQAWFTVATDLIAKLRDGFTCRGYGMVMSERGAKVMAERAANQDPSDQPPTPW